jgi:hypothetical protein
MRSLRVITAWNPCSEASSSADNELAHAQLVSELTELNLDYFVGFGEDPSGAWAGEESVLVLGIEQNEALSLGARNRQNAIVYIDSTARPALLYPQFDEETGYRGGE